MKIAGARAHLGIEARNGFEIVVEDVWPRRDDGFERARLVEKVGVKTSIVVPGATVRTALIVRAKCPAPPSSRSSRSTEVMTTCDNPSAATASPTRWGS